MAVKGRVILDQKSINMLLTQTTLALSERGAQRVRTRVQQNIAASGRVNTGKMRDTIRVQQVSTGVKVNHFRVTSDLPYTVFQELGIGPVHPVRAKVLRFKPKGANAYIFRPRTRGFAGAHFFRRAFDATSVLDFR